MSDYDMFPLNFTSDESFNLINVNGKGTFTSYGFVAPALMYASKEEWNRVTELLIESIPKYNRKDVLSDMNVFKRMVTITHAGRVGILFPPDSFVNRMGFGVYQRDETQHNKKVLILDCETLKQSKAIHFSHVRTKEAHERGVFPMMVANPVQWRGKAAEIFMKDYEEQCLSL